MKESPDSKWQRELTLIKIRNTLAILAAFELGLSYRAYPFLQPVGKTYTDSPPERQQRRTPSRRPST